MSVAIKIEPGEVVQKRKLLNAFEKAEARYSKREICKHIEWSPSSYSQFKASGHASPEKRDTAIRWLREEGIWIDDAVREAPETYLPITAAELVHLLWRANRTKKQELVDRAMKLAVLAEGTIQEADKIMKEYNALKKATEAYSSED